MLRGSWLLSLLLLLAGCQGMYPYDESQRAFSVPSGSALVLNRALIVPAGELAIYLQNGVAYGGAPNRMLPYCKFELRQRHEEPRRIEPRTFRIDRSTRHWSAGLTPDWRLQPARLLLFDFDGGPTFIIYSSFFFLSSPQQPDVLRMTCEHWGDPATDWFLSITEIRQALGEVFTLELRDGRGRMM